jgi:hypothetical protein
MQPLAITGRPGDWEISLTARNAIGLMPGPE